MATEWTPDTCDCVVEIEKDDLGALSYKLLRPCDHHVNVEDVVKENQSKNIDVVNPLIEAIGDGEKLPKGKTVEWQRSEKGVLEYTMVGFTEQEKILASTIVTKEEISIKDEGGAVVKEPITKETAEVIKDG